MPNTKESIEAALHGQIFTQAKSKDNERRKGSCREWKEGRLACVKSPRPDPNQMYPKDCRNRPKNCSDRAVECLRFAFDAQSKVCNERKMPMHT